MNKLFVTAAIVAVFFVSCATQKNAEKYYREHPQDLAQKCADAFPVRDSVGTPVIDSTKRADNTDYTKTIDSLNEAAQTVINYERAKRIAEGRFQAQTVDSVKAECREVVSELNKKAVALEARVRQLQANYKPCKPDTVFITKTVYRENTARVKAQEMQIATDQVKLQQATERGDHWRGVAQKRFWWIVLLIAMIGAGVYLRIKRIL